MRTQFEGEDLTLLNRYVESVLLRYGDRRWTLLDATEELVETFCGVARGRNDILQHMLGVVEAGDDT